MSYKYSSSNKNINCFFMLYTVTLSNLIINYNDRPFFDFLTTRLERKKCPQLCPVLLMPQATALLTDSRGK